MRNSIIFITLVVVGGVVGYFIGFLYNVTNSVLYLEIVLGAGVGYSFAIAVELKEKGMVIGAILGLFISLFLDYLAGSNVYLLFKSPFVGAFMFVGWGVRKNLKPILIGGMISGIIGFILGMIRSHWFGTICLPPGLLNSSLSFVRFSIIGMVIGNWLVKTGGLYLLEKIFIRNRNENL